MKYEHDNTIAYPTKKQVNVKVTYTIGDFGGMNVFTGTLERWIELRDWHRLTEVKVEEF